MSGWFVFDGCYALLDGPFETELDAETAAADHRFTNDELETIVGHGQTCTCHPRGECCFGCGRMHGLVMDEWQQWSSEMEVTA